MKTMGHTCEYKLGLVWDHTPLFKIQGSQWHGYDSKPLPPPPSSGEVSDHEDEELGGFGTSKGILQPARNPEY